MNATDQFEDLRPFVADEIPAAMQRIADSEAFDALARYVFPHRDVEEVRRMVRAIRTTDEFQMSVMYHVNLRIIRRTITRLTVDGLYALNPAERYLFISNHRDIMLDSSLLQNLLHEAGHRTTEITFGSNLMQGELATAIGRANKMFKVVRDSNMHDFLADSLQLSAYIRHTLLEKRESIWIAQRNGRTKDGDDRTDRGIVKMFALSDRTNAAHAIRSLHIVPVAVSYQWEPCDILKTRELYLSRHRRGPTCQRVLSHGGRRDRPTDPSQLPPLRQQFHRPRPPQRHVDLRRPLHARGTHGLRSTYATDAARDRRRSGHPKGNLPRHLRQSGRELDARPHKSSIEL